MIICFCYTFFRYIFCFDDFAVACRLHSVQHEAAIVNLSTALLDHSIWPQLGRVSTHKYFEGCSNSLTSTIAHGESQAGELLLVDGILVVNQMRVFCGWGFLPLRVRGVGAVSSWCCYLAQWPAEWRVIVVRVRGLRGTRF